MRTTTSAAAFTLSMLSSSTLARQLSSESATTASFAAPATPWVGPSGSGWKSGGSTTFILDQANEDASVVQFTTSIDLDVIEQPVHHNSQVCFERPDDNDALCIFWDYQPGHPNYPSQIPPRVSNYVQSCTAFYTNGWCTEMGAVESERLWEQSEDGSWNEAFSSGSSPDYEISHEEETGRFMYRLAIPVSDLPDQEAEFALDTLMAGQPVELQGRHFVQIDGAHAQEETGFTVAGIPELVLYKHAGCQDAQPQQSESVYYEGQSTVVSIQDFWDGSIGNDQLSSVRVKDGYRATLFKNALNHANGGGMLYVYGDDQCANLPSDFNEKVSAIVLEDCQIRKCYEDPRAQTL